MIETDFEFECYICNTEFKCECYGGGECPNCGQKYIYDEGISIDLSDEQVRILKFYNHILKHDNIDKKGETI